MLSRVVGARHMRKVAPMLLVGCLLSFAAGQAVGHYALPAPPLASLAARADAPVATAVAGAIGQAQHSATKPTSTHEPASKPTSGNQTHSQPKAKKAGHPHAMHDHKIHHRHGKHGYSGEQGQGQGQGSSDQASADQPAAPAGPMSGSQGGGDQDSAPGPQRTPPESTAGA